LLITRGKMLDYLQRYLKLCAAPYDLNNCKMKMQRLFTYCKIAVYLISSTIQLFLIRRQSSTLDLIPGQKVYTIEV